MSDSVKNLARRVLEIGVAMLPWLLAMYCFYWLESSSTWTSETPHRGKLSVLILASGMLLSFLLHSRLLARRKT